MNKLSIQFGLSCAIIGIFFCNPVWAADLNTSDEYQATITPISLETRELMQKYTWHPQCPVPIDDLASIKLTYWGFDNQKHTGTIIVNKRLANETVKIFHELYDNHFPIERMEPVSTFKGNDEAAMMANNTYGFNCPPATNNTEDFSLQNYGYSIGINILLNPFVEGNKVLPSKGRAYLDRSKPVPGMIVQGDKTYQTFMKYGWTWGGDLSDHQDYSHFTKDCNQPNVCR